MALALGNHVDIIEVGALPALLSAAESNDLDTRRCVAFALNSLCMNEKNHVVCERVGIIKPLVNLAMMEDPGM